jgi:hypothetical protein
MTPPVAAAAPAVHPRLPADPDRRTPRGPRRVSGPGRRGGADRPADRRRPGRVVLGLVRAFDGLAQHRLLDRLIRGRVWIALVAFALIGIVTLQLGLLKLNGAIGRALEHEALLQRQNSALSIENSEMTAGDRVELRAARMGMELIPPGALRFLRARPRIYNGRAAGALSSPVNRLTTGTSGASVEGSEAAASATAPSSGGESPTTSSPGSRSGGESVTGPSSQATRTSGASTTAAGESSATSGESSTAAGESHTPSGESGTSSSGTGSRESDTSSASTPADAVTPVGATGPAAGTTSAGGRSGESGPGGGTQAAPG